jgi:hypothetical protein
MRRKETFLKQRADKKLIIRHYGFQALVLFMFAIVLYDSFKHQTPFYYICFLLLGLFIGRVLSITDRVKHGDETGKFTITSNAVGLIITLLLLSIRFIWGRQLLELAHIHWTTDALYLLFIGIYGSKIKSMARQMDEIIYGWFGEKEESANGN